MAKVKELPLGVAYPSEDELNWVQRGGKVALEAGGTNLYFALGAPDDDESGSWLDGATAHPIKLTLLYFDVGTETIQIGYSSDASAEIGALETVVTKTDTGEWKRATYTLAASMRVGHEVYEDYGYADFRLKSSGLLILNEVRVRETALKVKAVWQASEFYIDESYEGTETDDVANEAITSGKIADDIQSDNYALNTAGWKIWRNTGDAEFNDVTVRGTLYATAGAIGGFDIGADYVRDAANSFGLASTVTGADDVRFWAGATFANRATAPFRVTEAGYVFAQDIVLAKGSLSGASGENGYGYAVNPLLLCHFDGARPFETDYSGSVIGHLGQVGTYKYNATETRGLFRKGKFGKAVQVAEATTNQVLNPSAETTANFAARGTATVTRDTGTFYLGATSYKIVLAAANDGIDLTTAALANAAHYVTFWASGSALSTLQVSTDNTNWNAITQLATVVQGATTWTYCGVSIAQAQANGSTTTRIRNTASSGTFYIDAVQVEQKAYPTPYCDGSLGGSLAPALNGHSWAGTANASASSRIVSSLTYPASGSINLAQGTISFWYFERGAYQGFPVAIGVYIDANNYFNVLLQGYGGGIKPYCETKSGGSTVTAAYSNATISGGWHHCVVTWTNGGSLKIYIDGTVGSITGSYVTPVGTPTNIEVGASNSANLVDTWLDDLCILPIVLTDHEIKSIYYSDAPLMLAVNSQELRLSGAGLGDVFGNANGLFGRAADGTPSFGILNGTVNATTWGGASESFDSGDFLFGSNASGKSNLVWDASAGAMYFRVQTTKKVSIDTSGTVLFGSDVSSPSTTRFAFFSGSVTYNSESFAAGDLLLGNNSSSKSNIKYDESSGRLRFRSGSTTNIYLDTDGSQVFLTEAFPANAYLKWKDSSGNLTGDISSSYSVGNSGSILMRGFGRNSATPAGAAALEAWRYNSTNSGTLVVYSDDTGAYYVDSNDQQALLASDAAAMDDNGWQLGAVDYGEFIEKQDSAETMHVGEIVFVRGRKVSKRGPGTPMIVSTYAGLRGGNPMHWGNKWLPEAEYIAQYGAVPATIWAWAKKHNKKIPFVVDHSGTRRIRPRYCKREKMDGPVVLNPEWDFEKGFVFRSKRKNEWIVVAFSGQVPVKVNGAVNEGDYILPGDAGDGFGYAVREAEVTFAQYRRAVGIAWADKLDAGEGTVLVAVGIK